MLAKLERLIGEIGDLNSKLILLVYADMSHPEHRDYSRDGVVVLEI